MHWLTAASVADSQSVCPVHGYSLLPRMYLHWLLMQQSWSLPLLQAMKSEQVQLPEVYVVVPPAPPPPKGESLFELSLEPQAAPKRPDESTSPSSK